VINKIESAEPAGVDCVRENIRRHNPKARVIDAASPVAVEDPSLVTGKRVLVVEDGPTLTHGGMKYGAGVICARKLGAAELVDPRPYLVGELAKTFEAAQVEGNKWISANLRGNWDESQDTPPLPTSSTMFRDLFGFGKWRGAPDRGKKK